ncbi:hypothetical protein CEXT_164521 [Caerostris extrusa]|uniref:Uncharacterized protein n=1 Tax=Caerostris extrusa TaxID=172846 RepID=A0AAV4W1T0_CAEEX|nr:hypothetical protein CEXT_164521 [Caerostris extrusa]
MHRRNEQIRFLLTPTSVKNDPTGSPYIEEKRGLHFEKRVMYCIPEGYPFRWGVLKIIKPLSPPRSRTRRVVSKRKREAGEERE